MKLPFYKYQATGNDFVIINQMVVPYVRQPEREWVARLCDRRFGIGADGLILLEKSGQADFKMIYYNSDGNESTMCGNGGRCIIHLAHLLKLVGVVCEFEAPDGNHQGVFRGKDIIELKMSDTSLAKKVHKGFFIDTGSPHYVEFKKDIDKIDLITEAKKIRYSEEYRENGINVNFVEEGAHSIRVRTYERGVEDETLSCGTGVTASALVTAATRRTWQHARQIQVATRGGDLVVKFLPNEFGNKDIWLVGPVKKVFDGTIDL